jgi:hypothetical protein
MRIKDASKWKHSKWAGGNTVVNCHDSGITLAEFINDMNTTAEKGPRTCCDEQESGKEV